jgi:hypothetical protein
MPFDTKPGDRECIVTGLAAALLVFSSAKIGDISATGGFLTGNSVKDCFDKVEEFVKEAEARYGKL